MAEGVTSDMSQSDLAPLYSSFGRSFSLVRSEKYVHLKGLGLLVYPVALDSNDVFGSGKGRVCHFL